MTRDFARKMIEDYCRAWITKDKLFFLSLLDSDVVINECTGDAYMNKSVAEKWFEGWHKDGNRVLAWDIGEFFFDETSEVASATWQFACLYKHKEYTFDGVTIIRFNYDKIIKLDEYQMETKKKYPYSE